MAPVTRTATVSATPRTIWKACFAPMQWQAWDVDVQAVQDVQGGCVNGGTFVFVMKDGGGRTSSKAPTTLFNVKEYQTLSYTGAFLGGLVQFQGDFVLEEPAVVVEKNTTSSTSTSSSDQTTKITYTFQMTGFLGSLVGWMKSDMIVHGVEKGLENIKQISENAGGDES